MAERDRERDYDNYDYPEEGESESRFRTAAKTGLVNSQRDGILSLERQIDVNRQQAEINKVRIYEKVNAVSGRLENIERELEKQGNRFVILAVVVFLCLVAIPLFVIIGFALLTLT